MIAFIIGMLLLGAWLYGHKPPAEQDDLWMMGPTMEEARHRGSREWAGSIPAPRIGEQRSSRRMMESSGGNSP
jgi:hypothetical protein